MISNSYSLILIYVQCLRVPKLYSNQFSINWVNSSVRPIPHIGEYSFVVLPYWWIPYNGSATSGRQPICQQYTHTQPFNGLLSRTTCVGRYQKDKPFWSLLKQEMTGWQWHQPNHVQIVCTSLQTDNHASTSSLHIFYRLDALPAAQPTASKHWKHIKGNL